MSLNRTLVAGTSSVVVGLGTLAPKVFADKSPVCLQALANKAANDIIAIACGKDFDNSDLFLMLFVGGVVFLVVNFWKDILQFLGERDKEKS